MRPFLGRFWLSALLAVVVFQAYMAAEVMAAASAPMSRFLT